MVKRKIVSIDEARCDGCGVCVPSCAEGAIQIVSGKARLVSDVYCDGLGACLGQCPQGAISVIEREAQDFDEAAVARREKGAEAHRAKAQGACPSTALDRLSPLPSAKRPMTRSPGDSALGDVPPLANWPIQLHLVPPTAPFLKEADVLLVADCAAFASADFHQEVLQRRPLVIGCPKLDDGQAYVEKLSAIIRAARLRSITVVRMEVPCCAGLVRIAGLACQAAGSDIPLKEIVISIRGQRLGERE